MGLTKAQNSPGLSFEFDNPKLQYSPGDSIKGRVVLNTAEDAAIGKVLVSFWGRAKSRIIQQHGQAVTYHRGRTQLIRQELVLYESQYTQKPGSFSWSFEFVVPEHADPNSIRSGEKWKSKDHFRGTTDEDEKLDLILPASNYHSRHMFGRHAECFIEYVLDVTVSEPDGLHLVRGAQSKVSTQPIVFHPSSTPEPIQNYNFATDHRNFTISSLKLLPENAGVSLGLKDRARSLFQRDLIPRFSFSLDVQVPGIIQLMHPEPIPLLITATPDLSSGKTTIDTSVGFPSIILRAVKVELKTHVRCRASGTFADNKTHEIPIVASESLNQPLELVHGTTGVLEATIDVGRLCDMRLGNAKLGSRLETPLTPNFTSYNVSRTYHLLWELEIECADKRKKFSSVKNGPECVVIMPAATVRMDNFTDHNNLLGADLAHAESMVSVQSTGSGASSNLRSRRSNEEKNPGKQDKQLASASIATKSKAQEAAEERALARLGQIESAYQRRDHGQLGTEGEEGVGDALRQSIRPASTSATVTVLETDNELPKYVP